jgi:hypothetical protein
MRYKGFGTKRYHTASDAVQRARNNVAPSPLKASATIWTSPASSAALALKRCRLNNRRDQPWLQNHRPHEKSTYNRDAHPMIQLPLAWGLTGTARFVSVLGILMEKIFE